MAHVPEKHLCDLCTNEIQPGQKFAGLTIPLAGSDRSTLIAEIEKGLPKGGASGPFGMMIPMDAMCPKVWHFIVCLPCIFGILPNLVTMKTDKVKEIIAQQERQGAATRLADEELDELTADATAHP